jgi:hypothetical protein
MTPEQQRFLQRRLHKAATDQPELIKLKLLLLRLGGEFIVAPPKFDPDLPKLLDGGFVTGGQVTLKRMKSSLCHQNVAAVWRARRPSIVAIGTGYALSDDGLWRQHSWGVLREGILETTEERMKYFGIFLQGTEADHFAACNPY